MKTLTLKQKIKICLCICNGLAHLHANRVAHRDLKPENILLFGESLIAKISDFGTSKVVQTMKSNTRVVGTAQYSAPELMEVGSTFGVSVDVYSMTVIFYELFSGRVPFSGTHFQVLRCQFEQSFTSIFYRSQIRSDRIPKV
jgi:serine/threonine protein kinase